MRRNFNICLLSPTDYVHVEAFSEVILLLGHSLIECGHTVSFSRNEIHSDKINIIFGAHLVPLDKIVNSIRACKYVPLVFNTEPLRTINALWRKAIFSWSKYAKVVDYSKDNIRIFSKLGIDVPCFQLGFQRQLCKIRYSQSFDIDVLFFGTLTSRRQLLLESLSRKGLKVEGIFGLYGVKRDALISRAKLILSVGAFDNRYYDAVRLFYLLSNKKAVVAESSVEHRDSIYVPGAKFVELSGIVDACAELVCSDDRRVSLEGAGFRCIQNYPQSVFTSRALSRLYD